MLAQDGSVMSSPRADGHVRNRAMLQNTKDLMLETMDFDLMCDRGGYRPRKLKRVSTVEMKRSEAVAQSQKE